MKKYHFYTGYNYKPNQSWLFTYHKKWFFIQYQIFFFNFILCAKWWFTFNKLGLFVLSSTRWLLGAILCFWCGYWLAVGWSVGLSVGVWVGPLYFCKNCKIYWKIILFFAVLCKHPFICLSVYLSVCLSIILSIWLTIHPYIHM